jgi:prepilin-type N-terminal cleavage/methylation domain-containing protein
VKKAFTLIELLVVIAIIAILAAILFPVFAQAKAAAKKTMAISNAKQIVLGEILYTNDYDDCMSPYFSYLNPSSGATGAPNQYWPGLIAPYIQKGQLTSAGVAGGGFNGSGEPQTLAQDLSKIFFDPIESLTLPAPGTPLALGDITSWGINDDMVQWWGPNGITGNYLGVNSTAIANPSSTVLFAETWDWWDGDWRGANADPGYPGSALAASVFDFNGVNRGYGVYNPDRTNGAMETLQGTYNAAYKATCGTAKCGSAGTPIYRDSVLLSTNPTATLNATFADPKGQNVIGFPDGHVKSMPLSKVCSDPTMWSVGGNGQWP